MGERTLRSEREERPRASERDMTTTRMKQPKPFAKETDTYSAFLLVVSA
jgi:hypothetical protein